MCSAQQTNTRNAEKSAPGHEGNCARSALDLQSGKRSTHPPAEFCRHFALIASCVVWGGTAADPVLTKTGHQQTPNSTSKNETSVHEKNGVVCWGGGKIPLDVFQLSLHSVISVKHLRAAPLQPCPSSCEIQTQAKIGQQQGKKRR